MKRILLISGLLCFFVTGVMQAQIEFQNGSFEVPDDELKYTGDGSGGGAPVLMGDNLTGWWAGPGATDSGRESVSEEGSVPDGRYTGVNYNNDGTIWNLSGTVEGDQRYLELTFSAAHSWASNPDDVFYAVVQFATYEGTDTAGFVLVDSLATEFYAADVTDYTWVIFTFETELPIETIGKNLLIGADISSDGTDDAWFNFDNYELFVSQAADIQNSDQKSVEIFPNPSSGIFTVNGIEIETDYQVFNLAGSRVMAGALHPGANILDLSKFDQGVYMLKTNSNDGISVKKLIIK